MLMTCVTAPLSWEEAKSLLKVSYANGKLTASGVRVADDIRKLMEVIRIFTPESVEILPAKLKFKRMRRKKKRA